MAHLNSPFNQQFASILAGPRRQHLHISPNKANSDCLFVVAVRMRANIIPTPALVHLPISTDQEIVGNIIPAARFYVKALNVSYYVNHFGLHDGCF